MMKSNNCFISGIAFSKTVRIVKTAGNRESWKFTAQTIEIRIESQFLFFLIVFVSNVLPTYGVSSKSIFEQVYSSLNVKNWSNFIRNLQNHFLQRKNDEFKYQFISIKIELEITKNPQNKNSHISINTYFKLPLI